jgi:hypothetical protein
VDKLRNGRPLKAKRTAETPAGVAQLVERNLAKVDVAGSSPVTRSGFTPEFLAQKRPFKGLGLSDNQSSKGFGLLPPAID